MYGNGHTEGTLRTFSPLGIHHAVRVLLAHTLGVRAVGAMDGDTRIYGHEAEYVVALDRVAALGQLIYYIINTLVDDECIARRLDLRHCGCSAACFGLSLGRTTLLVGLAREPLGQNLLYHRKVYLLLGNKFVEGCTCALLVVFAEVGHHLVDALCYLPVLELALELLTTEVCTLGLLLANHRLDLLLRLLRHHKVEPVGLWLLVLLRENLHDVAIAELLANRHRATIHLTSRAGATEVRVDVESKVQDGSTVRQLADVTIWGVDKYLARGRLGIETLGYILLGLAHQLTQTLQPLLACLCALIDTLVTPVGCDTQLGDVVHTLGANLNLHPLAIARSHGGVQRLVTIRLRNRYPVAHTVGIWCVEVAHDGVGEPALRLLERLRTVDDDTDGEYVVDTLERYLLLAHLVPDGVDRLGAALDVVLYAGGIESLAYRLDKTLDEVQTLLLSLAQLIGNMLMVGRLELRQREILQLALDVVESELVGNLCIEVHRLPRLLLALLLGEHRYRAHHLESVGKLNQNHTRILRVGDNHIAEVRSLIRVGVEL